MAPVKRGKLLAGKKHQTYFGNVRISETETCATLIDGCPEGVTYSSSVELKVGASFEFKKKDAARSVAQVGGQPALGLELLEVGLHHQRRRRAQLGGTSSQAASSSAARERSPRSSAATSLRSRSSGARRTRRASPPGR